MRTPGGNGLSSIYSAFNPYVPRMEMLKLGIFAKITKKNSSTKN